MPVELVNISKLADYNSSRFFRQLEQAVADELKEFESIFNGFTATWSAKSQPTWKLRTFIKATRITGEISTSSTPFVFVELGTKVRYATMTEDFSPKTTVGFFGSTRGRGRLAYVNRNIPRKGIEARNVRDLIAHFRREKFAVRIRRVVIANFGR